MVILPIDVNETAWHLVREYIADRRAEIMDTLLSLTVSDQDRRDAAVRIDELILLLGAPGDTKAAAIAAAEASANRRSVY
jgi:cytochrome P450